MLDTAISIGTLGVRLQQRCLSPVSRYERRSLRAGTRLTKPLIYIAQGLVNNEGDKQSEVEGSCMFYLYRAPPSGTATEKQNNNNTMIIGVHGPWVDCYVSHTTCDATAR